MYLHRTENGHYTLPCCYFSGKLEVVELRQPHAALRAVGGHRLRQPHQERCVCKLKTYISISAENKETAEKIEAEICKSAEEYLK